MQSNQLKKERLKFSSVIHMARHYEELREIAYELTKETLGLSVQINGIDLSTAKKADEWKKLQGDGLRKTRSVWSWEQAYMKSKNLPDRFEISVWSGSQLCAITYGRPSQHRTKLKLMLVESSPVKPSPLTTKAFEIISTCAMIYADLIDADEIYIINPINDSVASYYMQFGFSEPLPYLGKKTYMRKKVHAK
ncbi:MAG: hypothetical protein JKY50_15875 [Oleispira sp.]|nr:hypothetical protein [Oleispira sp.]MBL4881904.1 hypothetical protein [Oleispira sp.]